MRVFVACLVDDRTKAFLLEQQGRVRELSVNGRYTRADQMHLTVEFLGELSMTEVARLSTVVDNFSGSSGMITCDHLGRFSRGSRDIWWVGVSSARLMQLQTQLRILLRNTGFPTENRPYRPHFTLAREVHIATEKAKQLLEEPIKPHHTNFSSIHIMESTREHGRLVYRSIHERYLSL
jgi:2'-5' RNA ligase